MYYVGKGSNGVVIKEYYAEVLACERYLNVFFCNKADTLEDAQIIGLSHLRSITPLNIPILESLPLGIVVTVKQMKKMAENQTKEE